MKKPVDILAERLDLKKSRGDKTPLQLFFDGVRSWPRSILAATGLVERAVVTNVRPATVGCIFERPFSRWMRDKNARRGRVRLLVHSVALRH
jgi:hypothetical protein